MTNNYDTRLKQIAESCEQLLLDKSGSELTNVIFDTLLGNTHFPQFDIDKVENAECNVKQGIINLTYYGHNYAIVIAEVADENEV